MNTQDTLSTFTELWGFVANLAVTFDVPMPTVTYSRRRTRSVYKPQKTEIAFAGNLLRNPENDAKYVAVHEFAHHLDKMRSTPDSIRQRGPRRHHDRTFYAILLEVVDKAYSSRTAYPWHREYKTIAKWAWQYRMLARVAAEPTGVGAPITPGAKHRLLMAEIEQCADQAAKRYMARVDRHTEVAYLWYQPGVVGLYVGPSAPNLQWVQASPFMIPSHWTALKLADYIANESRNLPVTRG